MTEISRSCPSENFSPYQNRWNIEAFVCCGGTAAENCFSVVCGSFTLSCTTLLLQLSKTTARTLFYMFLFVVPEMCVFSASADEAAKLLIMKKSRKNVWKFKCNTETQTHTVNVYKAIFFVFGKPQKNQLSVKSRREFKIKVKKEKKKKTKRKIHKMLIFFSLSHFN